MTEELLLKVKEASVNYSSVRQLIRLRGRHGYAKGEFMQAAPMGGFVDLASAESLPEE